MKPPRDMSAKEYARWLNENHMFPFDEACRMAGYDPMEEYRKDALYFVITMSVIALLAVVLSYLPELIK